MAKKLRHIHAGEQAAQIRSDKVNASILLSK